MHDSYHADLAAYYDIHLQVDADDHILSSSNIMHDGHISSNYDIHLSIHPI